MTVRLVAQHESKLDDGRRSYGLTLHTDDTEGYFTARLHIRSYEGVRVESSWHSGEVRVEGADADTAWASAVAMYREWRRSLLGGD